MSDQWCATCGYTVPVPEGDQDVYPCTNPYGKHDNEFNVYGTMSRHVAPTVVYQQVEIAPLPVFDVDIQADLTPEPQAPKKKDK